jgi:hypothetical protein
VRPQQNELVTQNSKELEDRRIRHAKGGKVRMRTLCAAGSGLCTPGLPPALALSLHALPLALALCHSHALPLALALRSHALPLALALRSHALPLPLALCHSHALPLALALCHSHALPLALALCHSHALPIRQRRGVESRHSQGDIGAHTLVGVLLPNLVSRMV